MFARFTVDRQLKVCVDQLSSSIVVRWTGSMVIYESLILSPKCNKITTFLKITLKPENKLKRLQHNYNVSKNSYIPWLKVGKINDISTSNQMKHHMQQSDTRHQISCPYTPRKTELLRENTCTSLRK